MLEIIRHNVYNQPMRNQESSSLFLSQVSEFAPGVSALLASKHCRLTASIASHDVTNGYGKGFTFYLKLELLLEQCRGCFETPLTAPVFDCRWHRFETRFMQIADAEASTLEKALAKLESAMAIRDRMVR
jgi:hypothetical protein